MATPSFSVDTPGNITISAPAEPSSTHHRFAFTDPPPAPARKRSFSESPASDGGPAPDLLPEPPDSATQGTAQHHQAQGDGGTAQPTVGTPSSADGAASAKKRKTARGSRGVANLTPEQLDRKRANDREAQRAIRERQRLRTEELERKITELESTQPYLELQKARRETEAVRAELAEKERCLAAIMSMIQPVLGKAAGGAIQPCPSPARSHPPTQPLTAATTYNPGSTPTSATSPVSVGTHGPWQNSLSPVAQTVGVDGQSSQPSSEVGVLHQQRYDLVHGLNLGSDRLGLDFLVDPKLKITRIQNGANGAQDSPRYRHVPMKHDWSATISMMPGMQGQSQSQPQAQPPTYSPPAITSGGLPPINTTAATPAISSPPIHTLTPRNCAPTCPLDSILLDFLSERHQRAAEGLSQSEILGPRYPSVSSLLNPAVSAYSHPLSKVFTDILARFPDLATLPERVATLYMMFLFMRWQVSPTQENYLRLPSWFRPVRGQVETEHPAWYDHLPFPGMRERLVAEFEAPELFPFENFFIPFTSTLSVNWPYEDAYVLLASPTGEELMINPVFEQHVGVLANWTLGDAFERAFPGLGGTFNLKTGS